MRSRNYLVSLFTFEFFFLLLFSFYIFALPSNKAGLENIINGFNFDLLYGFILKALLSIASNNFVNIGLFFIALAFVSLLAAIIVHGRYKNLYFVCILFNLIFIFFYPIGSIISPVQLYLLYYDYKFNNERLKK